MMEWIKAKQLDIMLLLCGACAVLIILLIATRFLTRRRKAILIMMETMALLLLWFDRRAYFYAGSMRIEAYVWVRLSNFMVFFLTSGIVFAFNLLLTDRLLDEGGMKKIPVRLKVVSLAAMGGMMLAVIGANTGLYYTFDNYNVYHRGPGFLIAYIIPVVCPLIQLSVLFQYRKAFSKLIYLSLLLYLFVPLGCGILQIFTYGISIVNMSMVVVSIGLYLFSYLDVNNTAQQAHEIELQTVQGERKRLQLVFDQMANAFVSAVEKKDDYTAGNAARVADYARRIAELSGKEADECYRIYYAALLHDVGVTGIPDSVIKKGEEPDRQDYQEIRKKPLIGREILSGVTEFPYLGIAAQYSHERYDGSGYPEGIAGEKIPEIARIIGVADAYVTMTSPKHYRPARPAFAAREALIRGEGIEFDPKFAQLMVEIVDEESRKEAKEESAMIETELTCHEYRDAVTGGIRIEDEILQITFDCRMSGEEEAFHAPSVLLFDAYDGRVHTDAKTIGAYGYLEYGEVWFDAHHVTTAARKIVDTETDPEKIVPLDTEDAKGEPGHSGGGDSLKRYLILAAKYGDHLSLKMRSPDYAKEVVVALPGDSKTVFLGLTGEHCMLSGISVMHTGKTIGPEEIPRIAKKISYIDRMESDVRNIQIDRTRSAATEGIPVRNQMKLAFHTMSLPGAELVWHCPYLVLFSSDDRKVGGENYHEYALIKLNGENEGEFTGAKNRFVMKKTENFAGWKVWKEKNLSGIECEVELERKGKQIQIATENLGIRIDNTTTILEEREDIYVALTGDQCAITDIRVN